VIPRAAEPRTASSQRCVSKQPKSLCAVMIERSSCPPARTRYPQVAMNLVFAALIDDGPMPERGADHLGNDPVEAYWASSASLQAAFARPGVLGRRYRGPMGSTTGAERLQIRLYDLLAERKICAAPPEQSTRDNT